MDLIKHIARATGLEVHEKSVVEADGVTYFLAGRGRGKRVGMVGAGRLTGRKVGQIDGRDVVVCERDAGAAAALRAALPWTAPRRIGLETTIGLGDRLGLATPGHIRAVRRRGAGLEAIFAQQSVREMTRTARTPQQVVDDATWGVFQEGFREGFGADADHLQHVEDIDATVPAGFVFFTIDPGAHVNDQADSLSADALRSAYDALDFDALETSAADLTAPYDGKTFLLAGKAEARFPGETAARAAVKYGRAVAHTVKMYRHLVEAAGEFELEISVDETASPTSPAEHFFFASELKRLGVQWVSLAPRFVGRFEKGVDYIGDLATFGESFAAHVAVMGAVGPYKISVHSGSDKFSIYPIVAELADGLVHVKTAGTSYLEALRVIARLKPGLFREILDFARRRYETDRATYHVSAELDRVPPPDQVSDDVLVNLLEDFHARQVLHVTYGSVLTADGGEQFTRRILAVLEADEEAYARALDHHLGRHVAPFAR